MIWRFWFTARRGLQVVSNAFMCHEQIVETSPSIPLSAAENNDVDAKFLADCATTGFPRHVFQRLSIVG